MKLNIMAIPLTQGLYALIDGKNYDWLNQYKWYASKARHTYYARRCIRKKGKKRTVWMHRQILGVLIGGESDHTNGCGLDNRECNLRLITPSKNQQRQIKRAICTSKYKGISWEKRDKKWSARITYQKKKFSLGHFDNEKQAAQAYDAKAKELFGEFALTNF